MNEPLRKFVVRRIVVAADSSPHGSAALDAAVRMAERLSAQLQGVFVEDIDLVNLSHLRLGREFHSISGQPREFDAGALEEDLRREAAQARRMLEARAAAARVHHSFRVVRGRVEVEVLSAAGEGDLLVLGVTGRSGSLLRRPGTTALAAARGAPRSVLLLGAEARAPEQALVAYDGSDGAKLALDAALCVLRDPSQGLTVMLVAHETEQREGLRRQVEEHLAAQGVSAKFVHADALDPTAMCHLSREIGSDLLIVGADTPTLDEEGARKLIEGISCPILLIR